MHSRQGWNSGATARELLVVGRMGVELGVGRMWGGARD